MALPFVCFKKKYIYRFMKITRSESKSLDKYIFEIMILSGTTTMGFVKKRKKKKKKKRENAI